MPQRRRPAVPHRVAVGPDAARQAAGGRRFGVRRPTLSIEEPADSAHLIKCSSSGKARNDHNRSGPSHRHPAFPLQPGVCSELRVRSRLRRSAAAHHDLTPHQGLSHQKLFRTRTPQGTFSPPPSRPSYLIGGASPHCRQARVRPVSRETARRTVARGSASDVTRAAIAPHAA